MSITFPQGAEFTTVSYGAYLTIYSGYLQTNNDMPQEILTVTMPNDSAGQITSRLIGASSTFGLQVYMLERNIAFSNDSSSILTVYTSTNLFLNNTIGGTCNSTSQSNGGDGLITYVTGNEGQTIDWYFTVMLHLAES